MTAQEYKLYDERIRVFINRLKTLLYEKEQSLDVEFCAFDPIVLFEQRNTGTYKSIKPGESWGKDFERSWFHITGNVSPEWKGKHICARLDFGGEALLFDDDGTPKSAISLWTMWENYDFHRDRIEIARESAGNEKIDWWFEASAGQLFGLKIENDYGDRTPKHYGNYEAIFKGAVIGIYREDIQQLIYDFSVLHDLMKALPENSVRKARILHGLNKGIDTFKSDKNSVAGIRKIIKPLLESPAAASSLTAHAVGHAHIDTAWLWPLEETIRKCARSFSSQIELIDKYPGFVFGASQPQHFAFIKEHYPGLYEKIKEKVAAGRFELQGGMWVEADCNLISGESMVRQILHGKNFFMDEFGIEVDNLWLPDVFGYSAALPQILQKSGINYFVTQKISWNQFNRFPNNTFIWQGIDGSEVITHFPPEDNYNSELKPSQMIKAQDNFKEKGYLDEFLVLFGIGDGGGGPTEEIIESGLRQRNLEGTPRLQFGSASEMLHRLDNCKDQLPRWVGELYLEYHRGTLTTQACNKRMNRKLEYKLRQVEMLFSPVAFSEYPAQELDKLWKTLLINQFHDIIPGSSITPVYERSRQDYSYINQTCDALITKALNYTFNDNADYLTIFNSLAIPCKEISALPQGWMDYKIEVKDGAEIETQKSADSVLALIEVPALSVVALKRSEKKSIKEANIQNSNLVLENDLIRYEFDNNGQIISVFDKEVHKQVIKADNPANIFNLYEDRPINWDAWDIDIYYEKQLLESAKVKNINRIADGPVLQSLKITYTIGKSEIEQTVSLAAHSKRLDFVTSVQWHEKHKMLRVAFPVNIQSDTATFDIQYGYVKRPTHRNTSWDMAKFEVCAHKYADLSNNDYGVALLNDCKYGHKIYGNVIDLNILRSPTMPDPTADQGEHHFTYSLLPHAGNLIQSNVISEAQQLNQKLMIFAGKVTETFNLPVSFESDQISLEALKKSEKENAWIMRLVELKGREGQVDIKINVKNASVHETDLLERRSDEIEINNNVLKVNFKPFEIKTFRITI